MPFLAAINTDTKSSLYFLSLSLSVCDFSSLLYIRSRKIKQISSTSDLENNIVMDSQSSGSLENKQSFIWSEEYHRQFVSAVKQLGGIHNAKPKQIHEMLNIPGLKRIHVASHLQKCKLGLLTSAEQKERLQAQRVNFPFGVLIPVMGPTGTFSFETIPPRPVTLNKHVRKNRIVPTGDDDAEMGIEEESKKKKGSIATGSTTNKL